MNELTRNQGQPLAARELSVVTEEIKDLCRQAQRMALAYIIEIGRRLVEAKGMLGHGEWAEWLKNEVNFSQSSANNYMKLYEEYGASQITLFGAVANSQTFGNLPYSKALALLAVPAEEREEFAEQIDAEHKSVRELNEAIKERDRLKAENAELAEKAKDLAFAEEQLKKARSAVSTKFEEAEALKKKVEELEKAAEKAKEQASKSKAALDKALKDPKIPKSMLDDLKAKAELAAKDAAAEEFASQISEARKRAEDAEKQKNAAVLKADTLERSYEEAQIKLKTASPEVTRFKVLFDNLQESADKVSREFKNLPSEIAEKLKKAVSAFYDKARSEYD